MIRQNRLASLLGLYLISTIAVANNGVPVLGIDFSRPQAGEQFPAGQATHRKALDQKAFSYPLANLPFSQQLDFRVGNGIFKKIWVSSPSSTTASDGLGPLFNARSCMRCHIKDGRGHAPTANFPQDNAVSMFLRLSIPPQTPQQQAELDSGKIAFIPEPNYGQQLQDSAVQGMPIEGRMQIDYQYTTVTLSDDETAQLRTPSYSIRDLAFGPLHQKTMISPRITPAMIGLGLLEAISDQDILKAEDPNDHNQDGISGRANRVWNKETQQIELGRFGWKAGNPTLSLQNSSALNNDIGISNPLFPAVAGDCQQPVCLNAPNGNTQAQDGLEASQTMLELLLFYTRTLTTPSRPRFADADVLAGKQIFYQTGCQQCHRASYTTQANAAIPALSGQKIWPYTDLLLHDMGADLADNRPEFTANGQEWRTPPLWGVGMIKTVNGHQNLLHDGRARNLLEAILWHGGEAEQSKQAVITMPKHNRKQLIKFLESL